MTTVRPCIQAISPAVFVQALHRTEIGDVAKNYDITSDTLSRYKEDVVETLKIMNIDPRFYQAVDINGGFRVMFSNPDLKKDTVELDEASFSVTSTGGRESTVNIYVRTHIAGAEDDEMDLREQKFPLTAFTVDKLFNIFYHHVQERLDVWKGSGEKLPEIPVAGEIDEKDLSLYSNC